MDAVCLACGGDDSEQPGDDIFLCDGCDGAYHQRCHEPPIGTPSAEEEWLCARCAQDYLLFHGSLFVSLRSPLSHRFDRLRCLLLVVLV